MRVYHSNNFRSGRKIIFEKEPCLIESSEFVKPGKGQSFVRVKLRKLLTKQLIEKTFKSTDSLEIADVSEYTLSYLYNDGHFWYFINNNFEELSVDKKIVGVNKKWLSEQDTCVITFWNNQAISITPNIFVELKVIDTEIALKSDTINTTTKLATLSTGAILKVPLFIQIGSLIKVDTRSGEYVSRIK
ncbi:elongation factor P [Buchnera aphidicola]|jgi:elongation factor P|uniref:Elongation factor P n=1 Tax=Buchnera aphidicola subsp. Schizaphis graminum (strain Sg) TaxID=198804 RepID=EFP_BUCAP|nr:elongation factor P [Buchnera aphidicola]Q8KA80.1 RecName: Full=Elongation factor P; Short=EF-P [Buchnera aphidicola str. Sg (Schizaphis graminum)]AAM67593.1 elongation factor P [Buchnera aphidicola str. Sg (Schizaphis graminum)]AWI49905.1 elongation factor P [Buchnera aphidicola (Schizaphis graminum)]